MARLCSDSSRPYTPQGGTEQSPGRSDRQVAINGIPETIRRNYRPGQPVNQVPTASGMQPPDASAKKQRAQPGLDIRMLVRAATPLAGNRPGDRSEVSLEAIVAQRPA